MNYILEGEEIFEKTAAWLASWFLPSRANKYAPKFLTNNIAVYVVILLLALKIAGVFLYIPFPQNFFFADLTKIDLTALLNSERQELGLKVLTQSQKLDQAATLKAQDMIAKGYFAHQSPEGVNPWYWFSQAGYNYTYAGENLAVGFFDSPEVFNAWLNSPSHKANMVNPNYTEVGTAVVSGFQGNSVVVVQLFGSPKVAPAPVVQKPVPTPAPVAQNSEAPSTPVVQVEPEVQLSPGAVVENTSEGETSQPTILGSFDIAIENPAGNTSGSIYFKWLNFVVYGNAEYLQYIAYLLLACVAIGLFVNIMAAGERVRGGLLIRSLVLMIILGISVVMDKDIIMYVIPHNLTI